MARWSEATWRPVKNHGGAMAKGRPITVCLHHAVANGSLYNVFNGSRQASTHFWIAKDGRCEQYVDTGVVSWGGVQHNSYAISVETEGCGAAPHAEPMTEAMINKFARLIAWANRTHGIPMVLSESVTQPGFNYHNCKGGPATGCPCSVRRNMRSEIIRRAKGQAPSAPAPGPPPRREETIAVATMPDGRFEVFEELPSGEVVHRWNAKTGGWTQRWESLGTPGR
jgi:N-acetylmuramoyl-L-alanine amidase